MAMASVCGCSLVRPTVSSSSVSVSAEPSGSPALAEPTLRETSGLHSVTVFDRQRRVRHQFSVPEDHYILQAGEEQNVSLPFSCRQACAVRVRSGNLYQPEALGIAAVLKSKGYGLLCVGYALSDLELETQEEDEVYWLQFGQYFGRGITVKDDYALDLVMGD